MRTLSVSLITAILIGSVVLSAPSAFANPGIAINLSTTTTPPGGTVTAAKLDAATATSGEPRFHAHATLVVVNPLAVPTAADVCNGQVSGVGNLAVYRLVAAPVAPLPPGTILNAGGSADIHVTFAAEGASTTESLTGLPVGPGVPFTPAPSAGVTTFVNTGTGFVAYPGPMRWLKDGLPATPATVDTTVYPVGTTIWVEECDFTDPDGDNVQQPASEPSAIAANSFLIVTPPPKVVGGEIMPVDMVALFVAGMTTSAVWMIPTLGGIAGTAVAFFKIKRKSY